MAKYSLVEGKGDVAIGATIHTAASTAELGYFEAEPAEVAGMLAAGVVAEYKAKPAPLKKPAGGEQEKAADEKAQS